MNNEENLYQVFVPKFKIGKVHVPQCLLWISATDPKCAANKAVTAAANDFFVIAGIDYVPEFEGPTCMVYEARDIRRQIDERLNDRVGGISAGGDVKISAGTVAGRDLVVNHI